LVMVMDTVNVMAFGLVMYPYLLGWAVSVEWWCVVYGNKNNNNISMIWIMIIIRI
jgi:hypothetical protein